MVPNGYQEEIVAQIQTMLLSALVRSLYAAKFIDSLVANHKSREVSEVFVGFQGFRCCFVLLDIGVADREGVSWQRVEVAP